MYNIKDFIFKLILTSTLTLGLTNPATALSTIFFNFQGGGNPDHLCPKRFTRTHLEYHCNPLFGSFAISGLRDNSRDQERWTLSGFEIQSPQTNTIYVDLSDFIFARPHTIKSYDINVSRGVVLKAYIR
ncbi:MAG: hypothetical protein GDA44_13520 [Prochloron sp. SP5CPC1]|nr:hypothetical protein [Candidatus Paraprochloron terpiosi SP5CPC1]